MPWEALKFVGSVTTLLAFIAAAILSAYTRRLAQRRRLITDATDDRRADLVSRMLEGFNVDTRALSQEQQYQIALQMLRDRRIKYYSSLAAGLILTLIGALVTFISFGRTENVALAQEIGLATSHLAFGSPIVGGEGGTFFTSACDSTEAVIGVEGYAGENGDARIFQVGALCAHLRLDGRRTEAGSYRVELVTQRTSDLVGPSQGKRFELRCPDNAVVRSVALRGAQFLSEGKPAGVFLTMIRPTCARLEFDAGNQLLFTDKTDLDVAGVDLGYGGGGNYSCPPDMIVGSIVGRAGYWVDALGIRCRRLTKKSK